MKSSALCKSVKELQMKRFDYCDVVWTPATAKLTVMLERVHSKFVNKLPPEQR